VDDITLDILKEQCDDAFYFPLLCGRCPLRQVASSAPLILFVQRQLVRKRSQPAVSFVPPLSLSMIQSIGFISVIGRR
jgi:hypothetical protein